MLNISKAVTDNLDRSQSTQKQHCDLKIGRTKEIIIINDQVMLFNSKRKRSKGGSLSNRYLGPYIVTAITTKGEDFVLSELDGKKISVTVVSLDIIFLPEYSCFLSNFSFISK